VTRAARTRTGGRRRLLQSVALAAFAALAGLVLATGMGAFAAPPPGEQVAAAPSPTPAPTSSPTPQATPRAVASTPAPTPSAPASRTSKPVRLEVPAIGVDATIIDLGLNPDGSLEVPEDFSETGWWSGGPRPGELGPSVIAGHVDSKSGPAVFYRLRDLAKGDTIKVHGRGGSTTSFTVQRLEQHPKDDFPTDAVYRSDLDQHALRLITCGGSFDRSTGHYRDNIIVFATLDT
jgi:hypothetical protein